MWVKVALDLLTRGSTVRSAVPQEYGLDDLDTGMKVLPAHSMGMVMEMDDRFVSVDYDDAIADWTGKGYFTYEIAAGELDALEIWRDWIQATPELLVEGAKVRNYGDYYYGSQEVYNPDKWLPWCTPGVVIGRQRGKVSIDYGIEYGALFQYALKGGINPITQLQVWVGEE